MAFPVAAIIQALPALIQAIQGKNAEEEERKERERMMAQEALYSVRPARMGGPVDSLYGSGAR